MDIKMIIKKIPGFRTKKSTFKNVRNIILYFFMISYLIASFQGYTTNDKVIGLIQGLLFIVPIYLLIFNIFGIRNKLPLIKESNRSKNTIGIITYLFVCLMILGIGVNVSSEFLSEQQKEINIARLKIDNTEAEKNKIENEEAKIKREAELKTEQEAKVEKEVQPNKIKESSPVVNSIAENNKYLTKIEWSLPTTLKVAVEVDSYDGDILQAGTYIFEETNSIKDNERNERIYNIYISKNNYSSESEISFNDWKYGLGGLQYENVEEVILEKGDYIYINPAVENKNAIGHLKITKK